MTPALDAPHDVAQLQLILEHSTPILPVTSLFMQEVNMKAESSWCFEGEGPLAEEVTGLLRGLARARPGGFWAMLRQNRGELHASLALWLRGSTSGAVRTC